MKIMPGLLFDLLVLCQLWSPVLSSPIIKVSRSSSFEPLSVVNVTNSTSILPTIPPPVDIPPPVEGEGGLVNVFDIPMLEATDAAPDNWT